MGSDKRQQKLQMKLSFKFIYHCTVVVGTPYWMAPEIIEMSQPSFACDIWSVGCIFVETVNLRPFVPGKSEED